MRTNIIIIILISFSIISNAQRPNGNKGEGMPSIGVLTGKVIDTENNIAIEYSNVAIYKKRDSSLVTGTITDKNGNFRIEELSFGKYYLIANFIGYKKTIVNDIKITPKQKVVNIGEVALIPAVNQLTEVSIEAERKHVEYKIDKKIVNVSQDISASDGTAADVLENVPSVETDIDGNVSLRGSTNFTVLIDGKPSVLSADDILHQIPASSIENIEIITNPSAKYDPDGIAGILNIITKKNKLNGFSGVINSSVGTQNKFKTDILLNYRIKKLSVYAGIGYSQRTRMGIKRQNRETILDDTILYMNSFGDKQRERSGYNFKTGLDYTFNDKNSISINGDFGINDNQRKSLSNYDKNTLPVSTQTYYTSESDMSDIGQDYSVGLNYVHKFDTKGSELSSEVFYSQVNGNNIEDLIETSTDAEWNTLTNTSNYFQQAKDNYAMNRGNVKLDYVKTINDKSKFETGYQARIEDANVDYKFYDNIADGLTLLEDPNQSNNLLYNRDIHSGYAVYSNRFKIIDYQIGMRAEYTNRNISQITTNLNSNIDRVDYFPSVHLSSKLSEQHQLQASYSRRVNRPSERMLNPFVNHSNPYNIRVGNPNLLPEYVDSYELNYQFMFSKSYLSVETYYRQTNNKITRVMELQENNVILNTYNNLNSDYALGSELMLNMELTKWWRLTTSANIFQYHIY